MPELIIMKLGMHVCVCSCVHTCVCIKNIYNLVMQLTCHHNPEDCIFNIYHYENSNLVTVCLYMLLVIAYLFLLFLSSFIFILSRAFSMKMCDDYMWIVLM
jgi:hypothetical protein